MTEQEIETMRYELDAIPAIKAERDHWDAHHKVCVKLLGEAMQDTSNVSVERDEWKARCEFSFQQRDKLTAERDALRSDLNAASLSAIRQEREIDAYAKAADDMAMSHKIERDGLNAQITDALGQISRLDKEVAGWRADQKENLKNQCELVGQLQQALVERDALQSANTDLQNWFDALKADHDKLKDAARLALDFVEFCWRDVTLNEFAEEKRATTEAALKAVL